MVTLIENVAQVNSDFLSIKNKIVEKGVEVEEGTISNSLNMQWSTKLTKASITSIIEHLSTTTSGLTLTLPKTAKEAAFTTDEWVVIVAAKSNWNISLVQGE